MATQRVYLVVGADRSVRVVKRPHAIGANEIAICVDLKFPDTWGRVVQHVTVEVPDFAPRAEFADGQERDDG